MKSLKSFFHKDKTKIDPNHIGYFSKIGNDPFVDWVLILVSTCLAACVLISIGGYLYINTQSELSSGGTSLPAATDASKFDVKKLNIVTGVFDGRASERVMLGTGYKWPKDPSLP
jgi:hypothetical protein